MKINKFGYTLEILPRKNQPNLPLFWFDNYWDDLVCIGVPFVVVLIYWDKL